MNIQSSDNKKLIVLDTNILMHALSSIFLFQNHNIFIPMRVLEEPDHAKKGLPDIAHNVRQISHVLDELTQEADQNTLNEDLPLSRTEHGPNNESPSNRRLYFQTSQLVSLLPDSWLGNIPGNSILNIVLALSKKYSDINIVQIPKNINMCIKAAALELNVEDYHNGQTLEDIDPLYSGAMALNYDFWEIHGCKMESRQEEGRTFYKMTDPLVSDWYPNQYLYIEGSSNFEAIIRSCNGKTATLELAKNYRHKHNKTWEITAKKREQNFVLNILLNPKIDFATLLSIADTSKTLSALAADLTITMEHKTYQEIIHVGEDISFLPGTEEEKLLSIPQKVTVKPQPLKHLHRIAA